jgi:AbrB family looped-hinge helix DNA binding protein
MKAAAPAAAIRAETHWMGNPSLSWWVRHIFKSVPEIGECAIIVMRWHVVAETVILGESGRIVLPAAIRKKYGLKNGDRLTVIEDKGSIRLMSMKMALEEIRASIIAHRGSLKGILDEFIEERHEAARREASGE